MSIQTVIDPANQTEGVLKNAVEELLGQIEETEAPASTFAILVNGVELHFRRPSGLNELRLFKQKGLEFVLKFLDIKSAPAPWKPYLEGKGSADLIAAFTLHFWSAEPTRIEQLQALRMLRAPAMVDRFIERVNAEFDQGLFVGAVESIQAKKKSSKKTGLDESESPSPEKSTDDTGTN